MANHDENGREVYEDELIFFEPESVEHRYYSNQCQTGAAHAVWRKPGILKTCKWCGKEFEAQSTLAKYCSDSCRKKAAAESFKQFQARQKAKVPTDKIVARKPKTLADWCREADECNLDYGTYRALIEHGGKTFEELRAQAASRCVQIHAHGRVHSNH